jgi:hypothetical protein
MPALNHDAVWGGLHRRLPRLDVILGGPDPCLVRLILGRAVVDNGLS